jgi:hypothetical protein
VRTVKTLGLVMSTLNLDIVIELMKCFPGFEKLYILVTILNSCQNTVAFSCPFDLLAVVKLLIYFIFMKILLFSVLVIGGEESVAS